MKHIRDPVTGRCAVCESNGLDPSVLHNGIFYPDTGKSKPPPKPQIIEVREDFRPSPRPQRQMPAYTEAGHPAKPASIASQSMTSTASASQVAFATRPSYLDDPTPPPSPPFQPRPRKQYEDGPPRYSPEGSPSRAHYGDSKFREPQVWFIGEGPERPRREEKRRRSPSPERRKKPRERTPSPDDRWRRDRQSYERGSNRDSYNYKNRRYDRQPIQKKTRHRSSRRGRWCSCRRCCMIFWIIVLILLALGAVAAAIYFAVTGAENESSVQDITLLKDPRYLILGYDRPCRTTVLTSPTTPTTTTTGDPNATTVDVTTDSTTPTTTLILCYDKTTVVVQDGEEFRNEATPHFRLSFSLYLGIAVIWSFHVFLHKNL